MQKSQNNNSQNLNVLEGQIADSILPISKYIDPKTPSKKKQELKDQQLFFSLSPFIIPLKISYQHTAISQSYNPFNDGLKVIQTPYNCNNPISRLIDIEYMNEQLRPIAGKIDWDKTPAKSDNQSSQYEQQSQSRQNSSIIPEDQQGKQSYSQSSQSQNNPQKKQFEQKSFRISTLKSKNVQKKLLNNKKVNQFASIPQPNSLNKKVFCNCKKTKCLKLYCDCFRINQTCDGCNCIGCHNLQEYADERNTAILVLMDRNPDPFSQKIQDDKHLKGCNCKKSFCLKKYCQCYQAGLKCGQNCKCDECKNGGGSQKREKDRLQRQLIQANNKYQTI